MQLITVFVMENRFYSVVTSVALVLLFASASAASGSSQSLGQFLSSFNVPPAVQNSLVYTNLTHGSGNYLLAYYNGAPYMLINSTSAYSFVSDPSAISSIISSTIISSSFSKVNVTYLKKSMLAYEMSSQAPLADCLTETGLDQPGASCTKANSCLSCISVPVCSEVLVGGSQFGGPFQLGIEKLQSDYHGLSSNFSLYFSSVNALSPSTVQLQIVNIEKSFANISSITQVIYQNPLFPPPASVNYALCSNYGSVTGNFTSSNWYCNAFGFCQSITYNYTMLGKMQSYQNKLASLTLSSSQISSMAKGMSTTENGYIQTVVYAQDLALRNKILNTTLLGYNSIVSGAQSLLINVSNTLLSNYLATLAPNYTALINNYKSVNLTALNSTLRKEYSPTKSLYFLLDADYNSALNLSRNNTVLLITLESDSSIPQQQLVGLAFQEAQLSAQLSSNVADIDALRSKLSTLNNQIKSTPHNIDIAGDLTRLIGSPLAQAVIGPGSLAGGEALAPLIATIPAIIASCIILSLLIIVHRRLKKHGRIREHRSVRRNWKILYVIVIVVLALFVVEAYLSAVVANESAPLDAATSDIKASAAIAIAINGTSNPSLLACEKQISAVLAGENKTATLITINGNVCNIGTGSVLTTDVCLSQFASKDIPVIILTNSNKNTITAYLLYGTILSQSGNQQFTSSCLASLFVR